MRTQSDPLADPAPSGFTLAEILLGLTLLTLGATLLQPLLSGAKTKADSIVCQDHLRQLGSAIQMAAQDNNNTYPCIEPDPQDPIHPADMTTGAARKPIKGLLDTLRPYGVTAEMVQCPTDARNADSYYNKKGSSYMWLPYAENESVDRSSGGAAARSPAATARYAAPASRQRLLTDFDAVHDQRMNVLYADGHVKLY